MNFSAASPLTNRMASPGDVSVQLRFLQAHRLLPFSKILAGRGLIAWDVAGVAEAMYQKLDLVTEARTEEERRVVKAMKSAEINYLVIKGTALAASIYDSLRARIRTDMDILVAPDDCDRARSVFRRLAYSLTWEMPSSVPLKQEQWSRREKSETFSIDLHWDIRNHPIFRDIFTFQEMVDASIPLDRLGHGVRGLGYNHALLLSAMHWYVNPPDSRAYVWLLDSEFLWRRMSRDEKDATKELSRLRGLSGLLGANLQECVDVLGSQIDNDDLVQLRKVGAHETATRLIRASETGFSAMAFEFRSEQNWLARLTRLREMVLPDRKYMREAFPGGSRFGVAGLHARRLSRLFISFLKGRI